MIRPRTRTASATSSRTRRVVATLAGCALLAAACGSDDDEGTASSVSNTAAPSSSAPSSSAAATTAAPDTAPASSEAADTTADSEAPESSAAPVTEAPPSTVDIPAPDEYVVGSILSLTGPAAAFGETIKRTQDLYLRDVTEIDGVPVRVVVCDDASSPEGAAACARQLIQQDGAHLILGPHVAGPHGAAEPILATGPVSFSITPYVSPAADTAIFAVTGQAIDLHTTTLEYAAEQGWKRVGIIATTDTTGQLGVDQQEDIAAELGIELKTERIDVTVEDATAQVSSLKDFDPDAIVIWTTGRPAGVVFGALKQLQMEDVPVFTILSNVATGFLGAVAPVLPAELYVAASNVALPETIDDAELRGRVEAWNANFEAEYGQKPDVVSTLMLDAWLLATDVLTQTHGDTEAAVAYLETLENKVLFNWTVSFSPDNHVGTTTGNFTVVRLTAEGVAPL